MYEVISGTDGFVSSVDTRSIGEGIRRLGGGRSKKEDSIDPGAALEVMVKIGDRVEKGDTLMRAYSDDPSSVDSARTYLDKSWTIGDMAEPPKLILERVE